MTFNGWKIVCENAACYVELSLQAPVFNQGAYPCLLIDGVQRDASWLDDQRTLRAAISVAEAGTIKHVTTPRLLFSSQESSRATLDRPAPKKTVSKSPRLNVPDALAPGNYSVVRHEYDYGDQALILPGANARTEFRAVLYRPELAVGARPVVVLLHGRHPTCYSEDGAVESNWPCSIGYSAIPSHEGYSVAAHALASHGYVVVSVSANGMGPMDAAEAIALGGTLRGHLILAHLDLLDEANKGGRPELAYLQGKLDLQAIGLVGHSRGGEGIARAITLNRLFEKGYGIQAAVFLGSTSREGIAIPATHTAVILPFLDGDVIDLTGQWFSDLSRYAFDDDVLRSSVLLSGANHNYFNSVWSPGFPGGSDDAAMWGEVPVTRLTQQEQERLGAFYMAGFFRLTLGGEQQYLPLFDGSLVSVPIRPQAEVRSSACFPASSRYTLQSFETLHADDVSSMPGQWAWNVSEGRGEIMNKAAFGNDLRYSHNTYHSFLNLKSETLLSRAVLNLYSREGRPPVELLPYTQLSFHVAHVWADNPQGAVQLQVTLGAATLNISKALSTLWPLPEIRPGVETLLKQQVSIPLQDFCIDLSIPVHDLSFTLPQGGSIYLSDIVFARPALGTTGTLRLPFIHVVDVHVIPTDMEQEIVTEVRLSQVSPAQVSMRVYVPIMHTLAGFMRLETALVFEPGETVKPLRFLIPAGGFRGVDGDFVNFISVIEVRALANALFARERALLTTPRPLEHHACVTSALP